MLLMGLILFSSELLAKNSTTDLNVTSKVDENNRKEDPFASSINFDDAEKAEAENEKAHVENEKAHVENEKAHVENEKAHVEKVKIGKILFSEY